MSTYVMLTRLTPSAATSPQDVRRLSKAVAEKIREECPGVRWLANYALLGPYDYLDLFEAPDESAAAKVAAIVRFVGGAQTETWTALEWERYKALWSGTPRKVKEERRRKRRSV
jgi:uncharacterized protein with GYD domain